MYKKYHLDLVLNANLIIWPFIAVNVDGWIINVKIQKYEKKWHSQYTFHRHHNNDL